ncbi:hypothetical protein YC2023_061905 [Brassica napus]
MSGSMDFGVASHTSLSDSPVAHPSLFPFSGETNNEIGADKVEFIFKKPNGFSLGGSYSTRCMAKPDASVDLLLHLPKKVEWSALQNEARKPVLVVFPGMCALVLFFAKKGENVLTLRMLITFLDFP